MAFKADYKVVIRAGAVRETKEKIAVAWKQAHQECVGEAKRRAPGIIPPATGHNRRSINPGGVVNQSGAVNVDPENIVVDVHTTSGYGGYLETGTRHMAAQPYIFPAVEEVMGPGGVGQRILEGCL